MVAENIYNYYLWTTTFADSRTREWLLIKSPLPMIYLTLSYLVIVWIGPKIMKHRKPFKLRGPLIIYNFGLTLLNLYICLRTLTASRKLRYSYVCEPYVDSTDPYQMQITDAVWWFFFSKVLEFIDTFFFILRKKDKQLSFLHVYHHSTMFPIWWIVTKWTPGGASFIPVLVNSGIHVLMYSYYGLAALGPHMNKYLWWKKYLTTIQLIQFTYGLVMGIYNITNGCSFPLWMQYLVVFYMISFLVLFGKFYATSYSIKCKEDLPKTSYSFGQETLEDTKNHIINKEGKLNGKYRKDIDYVGITTAIKKTN